MTYFKSVAGALAIMAASGMIADFELSQTDDRIEVRVWAADGGPDTHLREQVTAILARHGDRSRVTVIGQA